MVLSAPVDTTIRSGKLLMLGVKSAETKKQSLLFMDLMVKYKVQTVTEMIRALRKAKLI